MLLAPWTQAPVGVNVSLNLLVCCTCVKATHDNVNDIIRSSYVKTALERLSCFPLRPLSPPLRSLFTHWSYTFSITSSFCRLMLTFSCNFIFTQPTPSSGGEGPRTDQAKPGQTLIGPGGWWCRDRPAGSDGSWCVIHTEMSGGISHIPTVQQRSPQVSATGATPLVPPMLLHDLSPQGWNSTVAVLGWGGGGLQRLTPFRFTSVP